MAKKVIGGIYRFIGNVDEYNWGGIKEGDLCVLHVDDGTNVPKFNNPCWSEDIWLNINDEVELVGVFA